MWIWDSEYSAVPGCHVVPVCASAVELHSGRKISLAFSRAGEQLPNPLDFGPDALHILFMATADLGFALSAGWGLPCNVIDLWVEYRNQTNGLVDNQGEKLEHNIISACHRYGVYDTTPVAEKEANRDRIIAGFPFTNEEMQQIGRASCRERV